MRAQCPAQACSTSVGAIDTAPKSGTVLKVSSAATPACALATCIALFRAHMAVTGVRQHRRRVEIPAAEFGHDRDCGHLRRAVGHVCAVRHGWRDLDRVAEHLDILAAVGSKSRKLT